MNSDTLATLRWSLDLDKHTVDWLGILLLALIVSVTLCYYMKRNSNP